MAVSVEFEGELKLRLSGMQSIKGFKIPPTMYVGMFAGNVFNFSFNVFSLNSLSSIFHLIFCHTKMICHIKIFELYGSYCLH